MARNLKLLVEELCKLPTEIEWVEFKHNNCDPKMIAEDISALANSAVICNRGYAYLIWGVEDDTHAIVGTTVRLECLKVGNEELENWLRHQLSRNADFEFQSDEIMGSHVEVLIISASANFPVTFGKTPFIRVGSYSKKLEDYPVLQAQLWEKLRNQHFEDLYSMVDLSMNDVMRLLNFNSYFEILDRPMPVNIEGYIHYMAEEEVVVKQDNGLYAITNLGAVLFARHLSDFPGVKRKAIRIIQYQGNNKLTILKEDTEDEGYVLSLEKAVKFVNALLPSKEDTSSILRTYLTFIPVSAIREAVANALIHQDFFLTGMGPIVEIFDNRVEITNPGTPLVDINRIVDTPPKSRNEKMASLMRRLKMCEELGRGWDRMVSDCETQRILAPRIQIYSEATKVSLFSHIDFSNIPIADRIWSTYLHACVKYIEGEALTNSSLRERFGVSATTSGSVSRLIRDTINKGLIRAFDPATAPRYMKYIPFWA